MTRKSPKGGHDRKRGRLSEQDLELWQRVAKSVAPLPPKRTGAGPIAKSQQSSEEEAFREFLAKSGQASKPTGKDIGAGDCGARPVLANARGALGQSANKVPPVHVPQLEAKLSRRLSRGRDPVEARLDLHGFRQAEAHAELRRFLFRCAAKGYRNVLVITGRGKPEPGAKGEAMGGAPDRSERGVLRRNLPRWLADPDLSPLVSGLSEAGSRHGGQGAFYIRLKRRR